MTKGPDTMVVCRLPSGLKNITTFDECIHDGGTVVQKIIAADPSTAAGVSDANRLYIYQTRSGVKMVGKHEDVTKDQGTIIGILEGSWNLNR